MANLSVSEESFPCSFLSLLLRLKEQTKRLHHYVRKNSNKLKKTAKLETEPKKEKNATKRNELSETTFLKLPFFLIVTLNLFKPPSPAWGSEFALCRTKPD